MSDAPVVLGINRSQDAGACLMQGSRVLWAIRKERLVRRRQARGRPGDFRDIYGPRLPWPERPVDVVVECVAPEEEADDPAPYEDDLAAALRLASACRHARISHHLAHVYGAFHPSPLREAAVLVVGQGSPVAHLADHWSGAAWVPGGWREVASSYRADRDRVHCIGKQLWDGDDAHPAGLAMFDALLARALSATGDPAGGNAGNAVHAAKPADLPPLDVDAGQVHLPPAWLDALRESGGSSRPGAGAALAAAGQRAFENALLAVARWLHAETRLDKLCFAGGAALNCLANGRLLRETPFRNVFVPPAPDHAGMALGCAVYGLTALAGQRDTWRWTRDYLGPPQAPRHVEAALAGCDDLRIEHLPDPAALCARMLDLLCAGRVLGLFQGPSEFGPRGLGHRSILADPRDGAMRDWILARIERRDWFLPLACMVPEERAADWFSLPGAAPFRQYAVPVHPAQAARVPAIVHAGGNACPQTVGPDGDPLLRALLLGFGARTGVPLLLAASLDGRDEPLAETPADAVAAFRRLPLHALAMPPFLATKRIEPELPP